MTPHRRDRSPWGSAFLVLLTVASIAYATGSAAEEPRRLIPFQGRLTDANNNPIPDGPAQITFSIYEQPVDPTPGPTPKWSEQLTVPVQNGQVNVMLGATKSLDDPNGDTNTSDGLDFTTKKYYLGIKIGTGAELAPRQELIPSFHARIADRSKSADSVPSNAINSAAIANGTITTDDIAPGAVNTANIAANAIKMNQIENGNVTAAKLGADVRGALAPLEIHAKVTNSSSFNLTPVAGYKQLTFQDTGLVVSRGSARLPCVGQVAGNPGPDPCDLAQGIVGLTFDVVRAGAYEVCVAFRFEQNIMSNGTDTHRSDVRFLLSETSLADINDTDAKVFTLGTSLNGDIGRNESPYFCRLFSLGQGEKNIFLLRVHETIRKNSNENVACPSVNKCLVQISYPFSFAIREVP